MGKLENVSEIGLTEAGRDELLSLAALDWSNVDIASFFGWDIHSLQIELSKPDSEISQIIRRGKLQKRAELEISLFNAALGGNIKAAKQLSEVMYDKNFRLSKLDLFGGPADEGCMERLQSYIEGGCRTDLSENEQIYIDLLVMIYSLDGQHGKRNTIRFLTRKPFCFTYERASNLYAESIEMFFANRQVSKNAMRAKTADQFDTLHAAAVATAKTTRDYEIAANILAQKAKVLRLDQPDQEVLPPSQYQKQFRVLSLNPEMIGLPPANRDVLAAQIDSLGLSDSVRRRIRMEAGVEDVDFVEMLSDVIQKEG